MITSAQLRGARAMIGLSIEELAADSRLSVASIEALEADVGSAEHHMLAAVRAALEARGILFLASGSQGVGGPGVRLKSWDEEEGIRPENLNATNDD
ncbi:helix-turn-helix domain-containing protein [Rhizobium sp. BK376]|uniref:helix-turn-helix domain-containing protein n=1 Tax=Rhizobium sp. BK376 TaxID=2512149 RepID=UPI00104D38EE|nr:helix-turn-helix domain-containing protein [Rhizobium sp. BK376]TCR92906.1 helix-turn-helix protein [Rhizobium sp. BK376]